MGELPVGAGFAGHRIEGVAGRGGMGIVYRARDLRLDRVVALKVIAERLSGEPQQRERFISEARAAASLEHPNVVPVLYAGEEDGVAFLAMPLVEGTDLRTLVRLEGALEPARAVAIVRQIGDALDAAHARGIVHRDVKPGNVVLDGTGRARLTDFGLSKRIGAGGLTHSGDWVGTVDFVAPEVILGRDVDHRADVYALGGTLCYLLTGVPPYRREREEAVLWAHVHEPPPRPSALRAGVSPAFDDVVARAMAKDPHERYPTAGAFAAGAVAALDWRDDSTRSSTPTSIAPRPALERPGRGRGRRVAAATAGLVVAGGAVVAVLQASAPGEAGPTPTPTATPTAAPRPAPTPPGTVEGMAPAGERPAAVALTARRAWVITSHASTMAGIDARDPQRAVNISGLPEGSADVATGFGRVWIANLHTNEVLVLDPGRRAVVARVGVEAPIRVDAGLGAVWALSRTAAGLRLVRIDPATTTVDRSRLLPLPRSRRGDLALGHGAVWALGLSDSRVVRVDPGTLEPDRRAFVGSRPRSVAVGRGGVWIATPEENAVMRLSYGLTGSRPIFTGRHPYRVHVGPAGVWASNFDGRTIVRIDPQRLVRQGLPLRVGNGPYAMASSRHLLWVTLVHDNTLARVRVP